MKTLIRIFLALFVFLVIAVGLGYFVVTRPAVQKKLVESQLPAGSSIKFVQVTPGSLELTDLNLRLEDGTTAKLDRLYSQFSLVAALFNDTIELRGLQIDGLVVKLPEAVAATAPSESPTAGSAPSAPAASSETPESATASAQSPLDALYDLGDLSLLFDIDSVQLNGALIDASRNRYVFDLKSDSLAPGRQTTVESTLKLESQQVLQGGLKDFASHARLIFTQKQSGGFEQVRVESQTSGSDVNGGDLLSVSQTLELSINGFEKSASIALNFSADLPQPEVFAPELIGLQGLSLRGELQATAAGNALSLQTADLNAASKGSTVALVKLKQSLNLGGEQQFTGELMQVDLIHLPLTWLNPWLSNGLQVSGEPFSAQIVLSGQSHGALEVKTLSPLQIGPFSLYQNQGALLDEVSLRMNPIVRVDADQTLHFDLDEFQLLDRYGAVISGTASGYKSPSANASPLAGLQTKAQFDIGLSELLQQPALVGMASVLAGQARVNIEVDGEAEYPAQLQAQIIGLRARDLPGSRQDYRLAAQLKQNGSGSYVIGSNFQAGSEREPSTSLQLAGQAQLEKQPMTFKLDLTGARILQADIDLLLAALQSRGTATNSSNMSESPALPPSTSPVATTPTRTGSNRESTMSQSPAWADLDGEVGIKLDAITLQSGHTITGVNASAKISEALLAVRDLEANLQGGSLDGSAQVAFDPNAEHAYRVSSALSFQNFDPAIFSKKSSGSFPVQGLFDGHFNLTGAGESLEQAFEDSEADLLVSGREGVLTAFELDERSQLGLIGASILGQSLNRPGITAMAEAVPYFKNMKFSNFTLKLSREQDKKVRIPELRFVGDNLLIDGAGVIAASSLSEVLSQPLDLTLGLGAKGRLVDYLETLQLLGPNTNADGFRTWNQDIKIGGSLGDPNTSALKDLLNNAARSALSKSEKTPTTTPSNTLIPGQNTEGQELDAVPQEKKKTKDEKRRDDIEMGLDLLNSVFG
ncbi:AsmA family protein [Coraliomargarita algicola]|uniref:AsmA family protein n=1 Tax=Coraliomargarita algicola TaxID=3092156 RepID=A0ABZ0RIJ5_9BACT|nr:AsmA family protein [Coraliomargarita sp. J2-16]WPJ95298.1 AsmA family protein [Coraliomargarita sp. J2-16]